MTSDEIRKLAEEIAAAPEVYETVVRGALDQSAVRDRFAYLLVTNAPHLAKAYLSLERRAKALREALVPFINGDCLRVDMNTVNAFGDAFKAFDAEEEK